MNLAIGAAGDAAGNRRVLARLARLVGRDRNERAAARRFAEAFLAHAPGRDVAEANHDALAAAIVSLWKFAHGRRRPGVRAARPASGNHPWKAGGTIVEVVTDDMPFVVDSLTAELERRNLAVHLAIHPVVEMARDGSGEAARRLSVAHFRVAEPTDAVALRDVSAGLRAVLADVRAAVRDWRLMRVQVAAAVAELGLHSFGFPDDEVRESVEFLRWLDRDNFTFLGHREYAVAGDGGIPTARPVRGSGLGILRGASVPVFEDFGDTVLPPDALASSSRLPLVLVNKGDRRSRVHRSVHPDTVLVRKTDRSGRTVGQRLFVGLFTSVVYRQSVTAIPLIRRKIRGVVTRSGLTLDSHDGRVLGHILENLPRDELFQFGQDDLYRTVAEIFRIRGRRRVALFTRRDPFGRYVSCLVYLPRDRFETRLRRRVEDALSAGFGGVVASAYIEISDDVLARMHVVVRTTPGAPFPKDVEEIRVDVADACRVWTDDLAAEFVRRHGEGAGAELLARYRNAFPASWQDRYDAAATVADVARVEAALETGGIALDFARPPRCPDRRVQFKVFVPGGALPLSDALPLLENMGFRVIDENPHRIDVGGGRTVWMHDFGMETQDGAAVDIDALREPFAEAFMRIWHGDVENDGFNALVVSAGLGWRQIVAVRALCRYLHQTGIPFGETYVTETLVRNGAVVSGLVALFETMFAPEDPEGGRAARIRRRRRRVAEALDAVPSPDEDRILRRLSNLVDSTLRTNFFVPGPAGERRPQLSFKFDSGAIADLPLPRPMREIFVYSPRFEGVHCRGGQVARGGIRWSDRRDDYRTEILGLMKAQMTKNAVIVPEGAKGGFVLKRPPPGGRDALIEEGVACYRAFIRGLLDLTDNIVAGEVAPPPDVVRRDGDDPYLVVAADKGTATFSDIANETAAEYGFWLGDAFAAGGSAGYDHKKMGITARGAWECVKRHFRELGVDIQNEEFTVVGIGDMSGDVFGNALLLSRRARLLGAFNHRHVFVDPDPDPAASWKERRRLFRKPRSSWSDYDASRISRGGGVFERDAKDVALSARARRLFDLPERERIAPGELIGAMLRADVDLLWFGGIGTYVKSSRESHADVGDRANDRVRVDGSDLRCRVIGEGANLGVTQLGRVEYALRGGRVDADFIDNSAGVASSDQEVNIKILLAGAMAAGGLDRTRRDRLLEDMTGDVAEHALMDNYRQSMALSHAEAAAAEAIGEHGRFMRALERAGTLDRAVEHLPDDEELAERATMRKGLTRPEIAVLLAYAKISLKKALLESDLPDDPWLVRDIGLYFPPMLRECYADLMPGHRLQREITATYVANSLVNRAGPTFVDAVSSEEGVGPDRVARAYLICREVFGLPELWSRIEALDNKAPAAAQTALHLAVLGLVGRATSWFAARGESGLDMATVIEAFRPGIAVLAAGLDGYVSEDVRLRVERATRGHAAGRIPGALARDVARLDTLFSGCDIVRIARRRDEPVDAAARAWFAVGERFGFDALRAVADAVVPENEWQSAALAAVVEELGNSQAALVGSLADAAGSAAAVAGEVEAWERGRSHRASRLRQVLADIKRSGTADLAMLSLAASRIRELSGA